MAVRQLVGRELRRVEKKFTERRAGVDHDLGGILMDDDARRAVKRRMGKNTLREREENRADANGKTKWRARFHEIEATGYRNQRRSAIHETGDENKTAARRRRCENS
jgi:hypothetical protein